MLDINVFKKCRYEIFPPFFARTCMFSSKFRPRNTDHRLEIKTKFINSSFITDKKIALNIISDITFPVQLNETNRVY